jgi:hypothetical protein
MKRNQSITTAVVSILHAAVLLALWPRTVEAASTPPFLSISLAGSNAEVIWDNNATGFELQSSSLLGPSAQWLAVSGAPNPIPGLGSHVVSNSPSFYRLKESSLSPDLGAPRSVNVPELQFTNRTVPSTLTVLLLPESQLIELGSKATFVAIVDGYTNSPSNLIYRWEINQSPSTTAEGSTNLTWRDLHIENDTKFAPILGSPTNSNFFTIQEVTTSDVAYYRVTVTAPGEATNNSVAVPLWAWQQTNSIIVYGTPVNQSGSVCSSYSKRIDFPSVWPVPGSFYAATALDSDAITWHDYYNSTYGCAIGSSGSITPRIISAPYYFTVYAGNSSPSSSYPLYLQGFQ